MGSAGTQDMPVGRGICVHSHSQHLGLKRIAPSSATVLPAEQHPSILVVVTQAPGCASRAFSTLSYTLETLIPRAIHTYYCTQNVGAS
jgi:hypothetical protein